MQSLYLPSKQQLRFGASSMEPFGGHAAQPSFKEWAQMVPQISISNQPDCMFAWSNPRVTSQLLSLCPKWPHSTTGINVQQQQ